MTEYPVFQLRSKVNKGDFDGKGEIEMDEKIKECYNVVVENPNGRVLIVVWKNEIHELIYQMPCRTKWGSRKRNTKLFNHYGEGFQFVEVLDNGFGKSYWREDKNLFALWSYAMDFTTIGTAEFHKVRW
jgi:hypothetical protein